MKAMLMSEENYIQKRCRKKNEEICKMREDN